MTESVPKKKAVKEDLNQSEFLTSPFDATQEIEKASKVDVSVASSTPPKAKRYICRVKCWTPKYGIFEQGDIKEFGEGDRIPSHFVLVE